MDEKKLIADKFETVTDLYEYLSDHEKLINEFLTEHGDNAWDLLTNCGSRSEVDFYIKG